ncbi:LiaI-LiaF-like domain-containing protein [Piscibacillus salipiscarius]|uniref:LiaI-LiaF-like domain-containing protein n=1 Tax=Piscibacillus salipiscarius TaxID=299480 RepID=A0ABW5Q6I9_9BACI
MNQQKSFLGIILIGIGIYFLLQQYSIPFLSRFDTWPTILIILGIAFLFNGYTQKQHDSIFPGVVLLGLGIHFHALTHSVQWIDHWGMYTLIIGFAFLLRSQKTNQGMVIGLIFIIISFMAITSIAMPDWFSWFDFVFVQLEKFWPILLILIGSILLFKK